MAEKKSYPQIPSTVWWGVRAILQKTPKVTIDERLLGIELGVQETAARAYTNELRAVGILTEDGRATPLANKWRLDETYAGAVNELISAIYPEGLVHLAPPGEAERQKVVSWFQHEGLGQGSAGNRAATYLLLSSPSPNEALRATAKTGQGDTAPRQSSARRKASKATKAQIISESTRSSEVVDDQKRPKNRSTMDVLPLNINVQIHISADAGSEQIESIFQAMRRYLYDAADS